MESKYKKLFIPAGILIALVASAFIWGAVDREGEPGRLNYTYASETYGFSFIYPERYSLEESYVADPQAPRYAITLSDQSGGGQIKVEVFSNSLSETPLKAWIRQSIASNFHLSSGVTETVTVAGVEAYAYSWDGGRATVLENENYIFLISGAQGGEYYEGFISSFKLE